MGLSLEKTLRGSSPEGKVQGGWSQARGSDAQGQGEWRAQSGAQEALSEHQHTLLCRGGGRAAAQVAPRGRESLGPASSLLNVVLGSVRWVALLEQGGTGWPPGVPAGLSHCDFETDQQNSLLYTIIQVL